jgi:hypothetical protein
MNKTTDKTRRITLKPSKRDKSWSDNLSIQQIAFVVNYCDGLSDSCQNILKSWINAGYKENVNAGVNLQSARKVYNSRKIQKAIKEYLKASYKNLEIGREFTLQRLNDTYNRAVSDKNHAVQAKCVELMLKYNNMLSFNINVNHEFYQQMDTRLSDEAKMLGSARIKQILSEQTDTPTVASDNISGLDIIDAEPTDSTSDNENRYSALLFENS